MLKTPRFFILLYKIKDICPCFARLLAFWDYVAEGPSVASVVKRKRLSAQIVDTYMNNRWCRGIPMLQWKNIF
jgi:hypothetical protein